MKMGLPGFLKVIGRAVVDWWDGWFDLVGAVLLWLIAQITIVFGPPATVGLYYTAHRLVNGESLGARGVIEGGRKYFAKAWLWWLLNLFVGSAVYANLAFYGGMDAEWAIIAEAIVLLLAFIWLVMQFYTL